MDIKEQLIDGLSHLILADDSEHFSKLPRQFHADAKLFDGWEPLDMWSDGTEYGVVNGPIDCVTAFPGSVDGHVCWCFIRIKRLSPKEWRGHLRSFPPNTFDVMIRVSNASGIASPLRLPLIRRSSDFIVHPQLSKPKDNPVWDVISNMTDVLLDPKAPLHETRAASVTHRKTAYWNVVLGYPHYPRARLATDMIGVRSLFADRDVGKKGRREALLHWVSAHWRKQRPPSSDDRSWVRQHLRGKREFSWNDMECHVEPSVADALLAAG